MGTADSSVVSLAGSSSSMPSPVSCAASVPSGTVNREPLSIQLHVLLILYHIFKSMSLSSNNCFYYLDWHPVQQPLALHSFPGWPEETPQTLFCVLPLLWAVVEEEVVVVAAPLGRAEHWRVETAPLPFPQIPALWHSSAGLVLAVAPGHPGMRLSPRARCW